MAKNELTISEIVESHKPKYVKYKYIFTDESVYEELIKENYPIETLDTINNDTLVNEALKCEFTSHERTIVGKAKEPTVLEDDTVINKRMITKADKKLMIVKTGYFSCDGINYITIVWEYERFSIMEIFIKV